MIDEIRNRVLDEEIFSVAIAGMGKNTGKTVTLNYLLKTLKDLNIGVTSIGIDGERIDNLTYTPKPSIKLKAGTLVATASETLKEFTCGYEIIRGTDVHNPLGEVLIVRLLEEGDVLIGGPERTTDLLRVLNLFKELGCSKALVDGAIDRKAAASPFVTDGMIFVTGASFSRDMNRLVSETIHRLNMFSIPAISNKIKMLLEQDLNSLRLFKGDEECPLPFRTALLAKNIGECFCPQRSNIMYIPGALMDTFTLELLPLLKKDYKILLIVKDGTKLFLSSKTYQEFISLGGKLEVYRQSKPLALAVNPVSIEGYEFDSDQLVENLQYFVNIPVFDPLR